MGQIGRISQISRIAGMIRGKVIPVGGFFRAPYIYVKRRLRGQSPLDLLTEVTQRRAGK